MIEFTEIRITYWILTQDIIDYNIPKEVGLV